MRYKEDCLYYQYKDMGGWNEDIFDHPSIEIKCLHCNKLLWNCPKNCSNYIKKEVEKE